MKLDLYEAVAEMRWYKRGPIAVEVPAKADVCEFCGEFLLPSVKGFRCRACATTHYTCGDGLDDNCFDRATRQGVVLGWRFPPAARFTG